jgi:small subunit ribosomal protein S9
MPEKKKVLVVSGKRKTAVARVVVRAGVGRVRVNRTPIEILEPEIARAKIMEPLLQAGEEVWKQLDMDVRTSGGGYMGQAEAARMAVANALLKWTKSSHLRTVFTEEVRWTRRQNERAEELSVGEQDSDYSRKMFHLRQTDWRPMGRIRSQNQNWRERRRCPRQLGNQAVLLQAHAPVQRGNHRRNPSLL